MQCVGAFVPTALPTDSQGSLPPSFGSRLCPTRTCSCLHEARKSNKGDLSSTPRALWRRRAWLQLAVIAVQCMFAVYVCIEMNMCAHGELQTLLSPLLLCGKCPCHSGLGPPMIDIWWLHHEHSPRAFGGRVLLPT